MDYLDCYCKVLPQMTDPSKVLREYFVLHLQLCLSPCLLNWFDSAVSDPVDVGS